MGPGKLILVVEDNALGRELMQAMLEEAGYRVACAANGKEALDLLRGPERPCLVLLDLWMPVMDGREFLAGLRRDASLASVPVILLSGDGDLPRVAASLGAAGWLPKPVELACLLRAIRSFEGSPASRAAG